jgi:2,3,4,5-tetrahydropyridine-2-carboxylate N-succinyltransferase
MWEGVPDGGSHDTNLRHARLGLADPVEASGLARAEVGTLLACGPVHGYGRGIATISTRHDVVLDVWFPDLSLEGLPESSLVLGRGGDEERAVRFELVEAVIDLDADPGSAADAYLRLHLLSARLVRPHGLSVEGIFGQLQAVAWTDLGSVHPDDLPELRFRRRVAGRPLTVHAIDKFPRMTDFVSPPGIRIADAGRVRLGAHLAEGTVVMHEGFVNFNAGTLGPCMVEGRITQGSVVDAGADIGAGSSIMGTLSGGGTHVSRIGKRCLLGANAGTGISLGDDSAVEAGLYLTRGTLVTLPDGRIVKAIELSGTPGILFRRHSVSGTVEAVPWKSSAFVGLNDALHA